MRQEYNQKVFPVYTPSLLYGVLVLGRSSSLVSVAWIPRLYISMLRRWLKDCTLLHHLVTPDFAYDKNSLGRVFKHSDVLAEQMTLLKLSIKSSLDSHLISSFSFEYLYGQPTQFHPLFLVICKVTKSMFCFARFGRFKQNCEEWKTLVTW
jgi:hypothetical protein